MKHGGNNNSVAEIEISGTYYIVKTFPNDTMGREKYQRESYFYKYCEKEEINPIPRIKNYDDKECQIQIEKIYSSRKVVFCQDYYDSAISFFKDLNKSYKYSNYKNTAQENVLTQDNLLKYIIQRYERIEKESIDNLPDSFHKICKSILDLLVSEQIDLGPVVLNPSDAGVHNTLKSQDGYHFIDFEYAGIDSFIKLAYDFYLHPANKQNFIKPEQFFSDLSNAIEIQAPRYSEKVARIFYIWWILRLMNQISFSTIKEKQERGLIFENEIKRYVRQREKLIKDYLGLLSYGI